MTPDELEKLPKPIERIMTVMEMSIMAEIVERIENAGLITPLIDWTLGRVAAIGESKARIKKIISEALKDSDLQIDKLYEHAVKSDYVTNKELYQAVGKDYIPYQENKWLQQIVSAVKAQTKDSLRPLENITQTTGFNVMIGNKKVFTPLSEYLERTLDKAMMEITTGVKTYSQAVNEVIDEMTSSGLRTVDYAPTRPGKPGRSDRVEVAVRRAVMTGVAQLTDKVNESNAKELNTDYWEVEWHMGARNTGTGFRNHQDWQGKVYSSEEMRTVCGLGEMLGFAGINCYHIRFAFIPGISKRKYTDEWLAEQNRRENTKRTFNRKEYDTYGAIQYQRKLERTIRKLKQDIKLLKKAKADPDDISAVKIRLRVTSRIYTDLSKEMDIPQQLERIYTPKTVFVQ
ncbi:Phage minor capsid protein 2 [Clostridium sp. ASBs410]|nr:Phage minor capsid protein 2 [Clostridium sp. ASBs410]